MIQCTNSECSFKEQCLTYKSGIGEEERLNTPEFKDECKYYYPTAERMAKDKGYNPYPVEEVMELE